VTSIERNAETSTGAAVVRIRAVDPADRSALQAVAVLHEELLPFGPLAALGADFLRVVCYQAPMRDGLLAVGLAEADGRPAGFVAYTADSERFHAEAMKRHVLLAGFQLVLALVKDPRRLKAVPRILRVMRSRVNDGEDRSDVGEVIGVGVRPEYLTPKFRKRTGRWLSKDLIGHSAEAVQDLRDWKVVFGRYGAALEARPLELGISDGKHVEVRGGLKAGERYAQTNSFVVKAELGKAGASHDH